MKEIMCWLIKLYDDAWNEYWFNWEDIDVLFFTVRCCYFLLMFIIKNMVIDIPWWIIIISTVFFIQIWKIIIPAVDKFLNKLGNSIFGEIGAEYAHE
jgi:hypothetical protein